MSKYFIFSLLVSFLEFSSHIMKKQYKQNAFTFSLSYGIEACFKAVVKAGCSCIHEGNRWKLDFEKFQRLQKSYIS